MTFIPSRRLTSAPRDRSPWGGRFSAKGGKPAKPAAGAKKPAPRANASRASLPAHEKPTRPASARPPASRKGKPVPQPSFKPSPPPLSTEALVGAVHVRRMSRGRKPPIIPPSPVLPPPPPAPPDFRGAAPTMHYGEAPIPPEKKAKTSLPRSTASKAAEAARNAVWSVSSEKTTMQIAAAKGAFEAALDKHTESKAAKAEAPAPTPEESETPRRKASTKDRWGFFREELSRESDLDDPHEPWRKETATPRHEMFDPATEETLLTVEKALKVQLAPSYRDFNLSWGGGRLFTQEWRQIRLVGAMDIERELRERLCDRMHLPFLPLVDLGDGDYLAFDTSKPNAKGEFPVVWWYGGHQKKKVSPTFADWLEQLVGSDGEAFWLVEDEE